VIILCIIHLQGAIIPHRLLERDQVPHRRTCLDIVTRVEYELAAMTAFMTRKIKFDGNLKLLGVLTAAEK